MSLASNAALRAWLALALAYWLAASAASAHAQHTSSLSWVRLAGAEDCIGTQALAARVEQRVGHPVFVSASQADLSLEGHVERARDASAFVATLVVSDRNGRELGRRVLRAPGSDCSALDPALVLVIAIGLDPDAALPATHDSGGLSADTQALLSQLELPKASEEALRELAVPDPNAPRPEAAEVELAPRRPARRDPARRGREDADIDGDMDGQRPDLVLSISGELGVLPNTGIGLSLRIGIIPSGFWPLEVSISGLVPNREDLGASSGVAEIALLAAGASLCTPSTAMNTLSFFLCAGARAGILDARGHGFATDYSPTSPWFELTAQAATRLRFGVKRSWLVQLLVGFGAPLTRDTFQYEDEDERVRDLYRPAPVVGRIELGAGVSF